jgi:pyruvate formate lyase activating enzyme
MQVAELAQPIDDGKIRCDACQWRCVLANGDIGRCLVRVGTPDGIGLLNYGMVSGASIGPIEDQRLWHFFPDSKVLTIGSYGYAFPSDQQRGPNATIPEDEQKRRRLDADRAANVALEKLCRGVVWTYNEPAVSHEYVLELLRLARASSRYTALITTGYFTLEALDIYGPYLDGINLDLRGFSDAAYQRLAGVPSWRGILEVAARARNHWRCHLEVTTRIHHGVNDNPDELRQIAEWIVATLGENTAWHLIPGDAGAETASATNRARRLGHELGLRFIYSGEQPQETPCPNCQTTLITRGNGGGRVVALDGPRCTNCGYDTKMHVSMWKQR